MGWAGGWFAKNGPRSLLVSMPHMVQAKGPNESMTLQPTRARHQSLHSQMNWLEKASIVIIALEL
eukprot:3864262-Amphidinium_carterae.1